MKTLFNKIFLLGLVPVMLWSCKKEENRYVLENGRQQTLTASASSVVLNVASETGEALILAWDDVDFGVPLAQSYTLQMDKSTGTFATPIASISLGVEKKKSFTHGELNKALLLGGIPAGSPSDVKFRVKSDVPGVTSVASQFSKVITVTITPYLVKVDYPALYVPGSYQSWTPATAKKIAAFDKTNDKAYEGYIYFSSDNVEFKFTDAPNWSNGIFGDESGGTSGKIKSPGDNFKAGPAGFYWIKGDIGTAKTWSATRTSWAVIGSSIPPYDWSVDVDMTFNPATSIWSITGDFKAGEFKFRANDGWAINYGDKDGDGILDLDKANLKIPADGKYKIELDLTDPGNYTFKVTKQ